MVDRRLDGVITSITRNDTRRRGRRDGSDVKPRIPSLLLPANNFALARWVQVNQDLPDQSQYPLTRCNSERHGDDRGDGGRVAAVHDPIPLSYGEIQNGLSSYGHIGFPPSSQFIIRSFLLNSSRKAKRCEFCQNLVQEFVS